MKPLQDPKKIEEVGSFYRQVQDAHHAYLQYWLDNTFLHWDFWLSLLFSVVPWVIWLKFRKKESSGRLLFVGLFIIIISCFMDFWGSMYGFWHYTGKVLPTMPAYFPWDLGIIPVTIMLLLQYKPKSSVLLKALGFAALASFVGEPLFMWLGFYVIKKWSVFYSFPIYVVMYLLSYWVSKSKHFKELV